MPGNVSISCYTQQRTLRMGSCPFFFPLEDGGDTDLERGLSRLLRNAAETEDTDEYGMGVL